MEMLQMSPFALGLCIGALIVVGCVMIAILDGEDEL